MHDEEEIHGAGMWILRPSALDHRDQMSHGHNDRDPEARFSKQPRARLTSCSLCFLIPMTLEMRLPGSEERASILRGGVQCQRLSTPPKIVICLFSNKHFCKGLFINGLM